MRPRLLDLFCGAGGAAMGYHRAGFDVTGVDIRPQPRYPFPFIRADATDPPVDLAAFDVIHASPPCQDHSPLRSMAGEHGTGWMLDATLAMLAAQPALWVVENVSAAHNRADFLLCGEMFGLRTVRHRRFTVDPRFPALLMIPAHFRHRRPTSTRNRIAALAEGHNLSVTGNIGVHAGPPCMGIDWMTGDELSQAIPPAYTEYIGAQLLTVVAPPARVVLPPSERNRTMRHYSIFLADGTCFSVTAKDAWDAKAKELAILGVTSQASHMRYAEELTTLAKVRAALRKTVRMYS